jgi:adenylate cyclase
VELRFSVNPAVRRANDAIYCIGGPLRMPHIFAQQYLRANESRPLAPPQGLLPLRLRAVGGKGSIVIRGAPPARRSEEVSLIYAAGRWTGPISLMSTAADDDTLSLPEGSSLLIRNQSAGPLLVALEDARWTDEATTAAAALELPEFRTLFPHEQWRPDELTMSRSEAL